MVPAIAGRAPYSFATGSHPVPVMKSGPNSRQTGAAPQPSWIRNATSTSGSSTALAPASSRNSRSSREAESESVFDMIALPVCA